MTLALKQSPWSPSLRSLTTGAGTSLKPLDPNYIKSAKSIQALVNTATFQTKLSEVLPRGQKSAELEVNIYQDNVTVKFQNKTLLVISTTDVAQAEEMNSLAREVSSLAQSILPKPISSLNTATKSILEKSIDDDSDDKFFECEELEDNNLQTEKSTPSSPASSTSVSKATLLPPLGITNDANACYAIAPAQLFRHIPSLKTLLDSLSDDVKKPLLEAKTGADLISALNKIRDKGNCFKIGSFADVGEVFDSIFTQIDDTAPIYNRMHTTTDFIDEKNSQATRQDTLPQSALQVPILELAEASQGDYKKRPPIKSFEKALSAALNVTPRTLTKDSIRSVTRFVNCPSQLYLKFQRGTEANRIGHNLKGIPYVLNLGEHHALADGTESKPLELKGFIVYLPNRVHYISYFQAEDGIWWSADDTVVKKVDPSKLQQAIEQATDVYYDDKFNSLSEANKRAFESSANKQSTWSTDSSCVIS